MVLIVCSKRRIASIVSNMFHYMGILSRAVSPYEALSEVSLYYRAVLVIDPETLPDPVDFIKRVRTYVRTIPIFAIGDKLAEFPYLDAFNGKFRLSCLSSRLAWYVARYCKKNKLPCIGDYRAAGLNATCDLPSVTYFDIPVPFSKTEAMIIRLLIRVYPNPMTKKEILRYAFKQNKLPDPSSVRTHISAINKKFKEVTGRPLTAMIRGKGYTIMTPEITREYNLPPIK